MPKYFQTSINYSNCVAHICRNSLLKLKNTKKMHIVENLINCISVAVYMILADIFLTLEVPRELIDSLSHVDRWVAVSKFGSRIYKGLAREILAKIYSDIYFCIYTKCKTDFDIRLCAIHS